jgi:hypothetical protein
MGGFTDEGELMSEDSASTIGIDISLEEIVWNGESFDIGLFTHKSGEVYEAEVILKGTARFIMSGPKVLKPKKDSGDG